MNAQLWMPVLLAAAVKATALLAAGWVAARLMRRGAAADRHLVWTAIFVAVLLLPALDVWLPVWHVVLPAPLAPIARFQITARAGVPAAASPVQHTVKTASAPDSAPAQLPWSTILWVAWATGVAVLALRSAAGSWTLRRMARQATPVAPEELAALPFSLRRPVRVLESSRAVMPLTYGWRRPVVLLPREARSWPGERRRRVLLHELAHVRRHDCFSQALARLACCLYWFHPMAWTAWREFIRERERACDDLVLAAGARPSDYAADLLDLARSFPAAGAAGLAMARPSHLEGRLLAILDTNLRRGAATAPVLALALAAALALTAPLAALRPAQDAPPAHHAASGDPTFRVKALLESLDYSGAADAAHSALTLRESQFGPQSKEFAQGLLQLADVYRAWGKYDKAQPLLERAVSVIETVRGPNAPELALPLFDLGVVTQDHPEQSAPYFDRALRLAAGNSALTARILTFQGLQAERQGDSAVAEQLYQKALAASPDDTAALQLYGRLLKSQNRQVESDVIFDRIKAARPQSSAPAGPVTQAYRVSDGVKPPRLIHKVEPSYTDVARAAKWAGTAILNVIIGVDGHPQDISVKTPLGLGLDEQAMAAIRQWRFTPGTKDGQPVPVAATIEVNFRLF